MYCTRNTSNEGGFRRNEEVDELVERGPLFAPVSEQANINDEISIRKRVLFSLQNTSEVFPVATIQIITTIPHLQDSKPTGNLTTLYYCTTNVVCTHGRMHLRMIT